MSSLGKNVILINANITQRLLSKSSFDTGLLMMVRVDVADAIDFISKYQTQDWDEEMGETHLAYTEKELKELLSILQKPSLEGKTSMGLKKTSPSISTRNIISSI